MFGVFKSGKICIAFVSVAVVVADVGVEYGFNKCVEVVVKCRGFSKDDMVLNNVCLRIEVDLEIYEV